MNRPADRWIRWTATGCVGLLALIAGMVSYLHMRTLVELHGQPGWVTGAHAAVGGRTIVAASTTLLADSRGGVLPWALLAVGSVASLAANVAVAQQMAAGRVIAAWPSFALIGACRNVAGRISHSHEHPQRGLPIGRTAICPCSARQIIVRRVCRQQEQPAT